MLNNPTFLLSSGIISRSSPMIYSNPEEEVQCTCIYTDVGGNLSLFGSARWKRFSRIFESNKLMYLFKIINILSCPSSLKLNICYLFVILLSTRYLFVFLEGQKSKAGKLSLSTTEIYNAAQKQSYYDFIYNVLEMARSSFVIYN